MKLDYEDRVLALFERSSGPDEEWLRPLELRRTARFDDDLLTLVGAAMPETDAYLFGRRTYEIMARYWPHAPADNPFTDTLNRTAKYVASTTPEEPVVDPVVVLAEEHVAAALPAEQDAVLPHLPLEVRVAGLPHDRHAAMGPDLLDERLRRLHVEDDPFPGPAGQQFPGAHDSSFAARGAGSNVIWMDPEHDLVVVVRWIDKAYVGEFVRRMDAAIASRNIEYEAKRESQRLGPPVLKRVAAGTPLSYGHRFVAPADGWVATLPIGYADGVPRALTNSAQALVGGRRYPVAGTVTMDQTLLWCGDDELAVGDEVVLLGRQGDEVVRVEEWATTLGTITYEVVSQLTARVPRLYRGGGPQHDST